jgi:GDP/UDP-N,N'-diacetylbacillosamine 2-epimerase (hydrolysing)
MKKRNVVVTTGTRSDYGILRPVLDEIKNSEKLDLKLIVTGSHFSKEHGMTVNQIKKDGYKITGKIDMIPKKDSQFESTKILGKAIISFSNIFKKLKPDINLILGDRDEMLASTIAAYHMNIPNAHIHGGDKSGGLDEYTRHAITKLSNIHFAATKKSANRILQMGEKVEFIIHTGSPSIDEIVKKKITEKNKLEEKYGIKIKGYEILLLQHPVTTEIDETEMQITQTLDAIIKLKKKTIIIGSNLDPGNKIIYEKMIKVAKKCDFIEFYPTLPRNDYLGFLKNCGVLVGNSSSGIIEASFFKKPVVNIGIRQKFREKGPNVIDVKYFHQKSIFNAIEKALNLDKLEQSSIYGKGKASKKIIKYLEEVKLDRKLLQKQITY